MRITDMYEIAMNDRAIANIDRVQEYVDEIADEIFEAGKDIETAKLFHDDIYCADLSSIEEITYELVKWLCECPGYDSIKIECEVNDKTLIFDSSKEK